LRHVNREKQTEKGEGAVTMGPSETKTGGHVRRKGRGKRGEEEREKKKGEV